MNTNWLDYTLLTLVIIGAINWGLIGFFRFDLVAFIFGNMSWFSRIIYALVGLGGLYLISLFGRIRSVDHKVRLGGQTFGGFSCGGDDGGLLSAAESAGAWCEQR